MSLNAEELNRYTYERRRLQPIRKTFPTLSYPLYDRKATPQKCLNCGTLYFKNPKELIVCHVCGARRV